MCISLVSFRTSLGLDLNKQWSSTLFEPSLIYIDFLILEWTGISKLYVSPIYPLSTMEVLEFNMETQEKDTLFIELRFSFSIVTRCEWKDDSPFFENLGFGLQYYLGLLVLWLFIKSLSSVFIPFLYRIPFTLCWNALPWFQFQG